MRKGTILLLALIIIGLNCFAEDHLKSVDLIVTNGAAKLVFKDYGSARLDMKPFSGAAEISKADIIFSAKSNDLLYLVIHMIGPSNLRGGGGYCGAGEEENLVWLELSHTSLLAEMSFLYGSCVFSIEHDDVDIANDVLTIKCVSYSESRYFVITYNNKKPNQGLQLANSTFGK
jgi:hypothetical protein